MQARQARPSGRYFGDGPSKLMATGRFRLVRRLWRGRERAAIYVAD
jgi:hypothetical protein